MYSIIISTCCCLWITMVQVLDGKPYAGKRLSYEGVSRAKLSLTFSIFPHQSNLNDFNQLSLTFSIFSYQSNLNDFNQLSLTFSIFPYQSNLIDFNLFPDGLEFRRMDTSGWWWWRIHWYFINCSPSKSYSTLFILISFLSFIRVVK